MKREQSLKHHIRSVTEGEDEGGKEGQSDSRPQKHPTTCPGDEHISRILKGDYRVKCGLPALVPLLDTS